MTAVAMLALALGTGLVSQDPDPILPDVPTPKAQSWTLSGTTEIHMTFSVAETPVPMGVKYNYCNRTCRGGKHLLHPECDDSCDRPCVGIHRDKILARVRLSHEYFYPDSGGTPGSIGSGLARFGVPSTFDSLHYSAERRMKEDLKVVDENVLGPLDYEWKSDHWNNQPCTARGKAFRYYRLGVTAKWRLIRFDTAPDGRQIRVDGPSGEGEIGYIMVPDKQAITLPPQVECRCTVVKNSSTEHGYVPPAETELRGEVKDTGVCMGEGPGAPQATDKLLADCKFELVCEDMNDCTVSATNPTNEPLVLSVNPGTVCIPNDSAVQTMGVVDQIVLRLGPRESVSVTIPVAHDAIGAALFDFDSAKGGVLCLNMHKKEPNKNVKFKVGLPSETYIAQLAYYTSVQRFRGVRDQVRMWIATDKATFDEVGKTLMGGPAEGSYLSALYEVHHYSSVDTTSTAYRRCWQPSLIVGGSAGEEETEWFVRSISQWDADGLARWVRGNLGKFAELFAPDARDYHREHAARVGRLLGSSQNPSLRSAAVDYLLKGVPVAARSELSDNGGIDGIGMWLTTGNVQAAEHALAVLEAYKSPRGAYWAANVSPELPQAVKDRAAKLK